VGLFVGTSGWAYSEWKGAFYPSDLPQSRFLSHYAGVFGACETNTTFYGLQSDSTLSRWASSTPDHFRFAVKAHRRLTHRKQIATGGELRFLRAFLDSLAPLGPRLACVLFQLPPHRERDDAALERLLAALPANVPPAFEFRHESWISDEITERIAEAGGTTCLADVQGSAPERLPPGPIGYVRLRAEHYTEEQRARWLALLHREAGGRDVYAFAKHEGVPAGDPYAGVGLAQWLAANS
jgi:uncharacterized protein YecE (DUF72 family)